MQCYALEKAVVLVYHGILQMSKTPNWTRQVRSLYTQEQCSTRWTWIDLANTLDDDRPLLPVRSASKTGLEGC